jgi:pyruvate kinase
LAVTPHVNIARQLQLVWGVRPLMVLDLPSPTQTLQAAIGLAQEQYVLREGDLVVMTAGTLQGISGSTDLIKVEVVTSVLGRGRGIGQSSVSGRARVVKNLMDANSLEAGEILVAPATSVDCIEAIRRAGGVITEDGSLTGHAATIAQRLGIPVIVGVDGATDAIRDGAIVTLDAPRGAIYSGAVGAISE